MIHFAYPNVKPRDSKFLGCGRYAASSLGEKPGPDYELVKLSIPNKSEVHLAALKLAPEISDSKRVIYEKKDESTERYRGESLDLAYMLTLISRCRRIRSRMGEKMKGDIWCTGRIDIKNNEFPFLKAVDFSGFELKLKAFLSNENKDRLFIAPESNIDPSLQGMFMQEDVEVLSMKRFLELSDPELSKKKIILKVPENELGPLVNLIFDKASGTAVDAPNPGIGPGKPRGKWMVGFAMLLVSLAALWMYDAFTVTPSVEESTETSSIDQIIACLENGAFPEARDLLEEASFDDHEIQELNILISTTVKLSGDFIYSFYIAGRPKIERHPLDSIEPGTIIVSNNENFKLEICNNPEIGMFFLYIFQIDELRTTRRIFPNTEWNNFGNPVSCSDFPCNIPSKKEWLYLDKDSLQEGGQTIDESIYIIASPWEARDIDILYEHLRNETETSRKKKMVEEFIGILRFRETSNFKSVFYQKIPLKHWP